MNCLSFQTEDLIVIGLFLLILFFQPFLSSRFFRFITNETNNLKTFKKKLPKLLIIFSKATKVYLMGFFLIFTHRKNFVDSCRRTIPGGFALIICSHLVLLLRYVCIIKRVGIFASLRVSFLLLFIAPSKCISTGSNKEKRWIWLLAWWYCCPLPWLRLGRCFKL